jgi:hypothetical protein
MRVRNFPSARAQQDGLAKPDQTVEETTGFLLAISCNFTVRVGESGSRNLHAEQAHIVGKLPGYARLSDLCDNLAK